MDDSTSVCSNVSDGTSIYDEVEGKEIKKKYLEEEFFLFSGCSNSK